MRVEEIAHKLNDVAIAIDFRLTALVRLQKDNALKGWSLPSEQAGMDYIHGELVKAAAEEPLFVDSKDQVGF